MIFKPTESGGRIAEGKTPFGDYRVEWDADGKLVGESVEIKQPPGPADDQVRDAIRRANICRGCEHCKNVTLTARTRPVFGVRCAKCGCGNMSLITGKCPLNKWDQADAT